MRGIAERVAAGAAFLDENDPGWARRIFLLTLDLRECALCILGQLSGDYDDGLTDLGLDDEQAVMLGFAESSFLIEHCDYDALTAEWKRVITERRSAS